MPTKKKTLYGSTLWRLNVLVLSCLIAKISIAGDLAYIGFYTQGEAVVFNRGVFQEHFSDEREVIEMGKKVLDGYLYIYRKGHTEGSSCYMEVIETVDFNGQPFRIDPEHEQFSQGVFLHEDSVTQIVSCVDAGCDKFNQVVDPWSKVPVYTACGIVNRDAVRCGCQIQRVNDDKTIAVLADFSLCETKIIVSGEPSNTWLVGDFDQYH